MEISDLAKSTKISLVEIPHPTKKTIDLILEEMSKSRILCVQIDNEVYEVTDNTNMPINFVFTGVRRITFKLIPKKKEK